MSFDRHVLAHDLKVGAHGFSLLMVVGAVVAALAVGCHGGSLDWVNDAGADADVDGDNDGGEDTGDLCLGVDCSTGEVCVDGRCVAPDPCTNVLCENPGEVCVDGACVAGIADEDGDGYPAAADCDDRDAAVHPGAAEICNGVDDDCNAEIDEGFDLDGDGYSICGGGDVALADCDDLAADVHPAQSESCNGRDDDCDGEVDEELTDVGGSCGTSTGACSTGTAGVRRWRSELRRIGRSSLGSVRS